LTDPEERARHLALAADCPDPAVASSLDVAAGRAAARGAPDAAAALAEEARAHTRPDDVEATGNRSIVAADYHLEAGDTVRAHALLEGVLATAPAGSTRARVLHRLALVRVREESYPAGIRLLEQALGEVGDDASLRVAVERELAIVVHQSGDLRRAAAHARSARALADGLGDPDIIAAASIELAYAEFQLGKGLPRQLLTAASAERMRRGSLWHPGLFAPEIMRAAMLKWSDNFDAARSALEALHDEARDRYGSFPPLLFQLGELECWAGNWDLAARYAREGREASLQSGAQSMDDLALCLEALVQAHVGHADAARSAAKEALAISERNSNLRHMLRCLDVLGFLELSLGNPAGAHGYLRQTAQRATEAGYGDPGILRFHGDAIEAMVGVGDLDEADRLLRELELQGRALGRVWALAVAGRCRGLLMAARGDLDAAGRPLRDALAEHERLPMPLELGRTLLTLGTLQRRRKQKRLARESLTRALAIFDRLGAQLWTATTTAQLGRIGGRPPAPAELTPTEEQIAALVATGHTNREVAASLFMSVKTVETHMTHIFRKLGVRTRRELARTIRNEATSGQDP
jgi:DNA-binding CsgD family transcriptional regulator/tetratricopeptide (TPR) repeat protein